MNELKLIEIKILRTAADLYLKKGYSATTTQEIAEKSRVKKSNLHYHFRTKEDILLLLTEAMLEFHLDKIKKSQSDGDDNLMSYCSEIVMQIALCEHNEYARDLYLAIYSGEETLSYVKDWTAKKNHDILGKYLPDWDYDKFRLFENISCCIERSALTELCNGKYTLEQKIELILDSLMKLYDIEKAEREKVISKVLKLDYVAIGEELFKNLTEFVNNKYKKMLDDAIKKEFY